MLRSVLTKYTVCCTEIDSDCTDLLQHLLDAVLGFLADLRPGVRLEVQIALQDAVKDLLLALTPEGRHPTQQDVQNHPTTPDVCLVAVVSPQHLCTTKRSCQPAHAITFVHEFSPLTDLRQQSHQSVHWQI